MNEEKLLNIFNKLTAIDKKFDEANKLFKEAKLDLKILYFEIKDNLSNTY